MQKSKEPELTEAMDGYIQDEEGKWIPNYDLTLIDFEEGDIVTGEIVRIDRDEVLVDIGYKSEGVIPSSELAIKHDIDPREVVQLGEQIEALVLQKEDKEGRLILSRKRAEYEKSWSRIEEQNKKGEFVHGQVVEVVKGGLIIDIGLRGFLPASLVDIRRVKDLQEFVGQKVECKIIEINRNRNNVVLSRRAVLEEEKKEQREQILDNLEKGKIVKGCVSSIVPFGAFVDLDGIDGLIHISELSWDHVDHPSEVLSVGDEVEVQVLEVNRERQRVSLGYKQLQENPWNKVVEKWSTGTTTEGVVTKLVPFGAFVSLEDGTEGLVHISEIAHEHVESADEVLAIGQTMTVKVIGSDADKRRLNLSIKQTVEVKPSDKKKDSESEIQVDKADTERTAVDKAAELEEAEPEIEKVEKKEVAKKKASDKPSKEITNHIEVGTEEAVKLKKKAPPKKKIQPTVDKEDAGAVATITEAPLPDEQVEVADDASLESILEAMKKERGSKN